MFCPKCNSKMKTQGTVDDNWRFYKCKACGYEMAKHIHWRNYLDAHSERMDYD